jgi:hypothetical protein
MITRLNPSLLNLQYYCKIYKIVFFSYNILVAGRLFLNLSVYHILTILAAENIYLGFYDFL